MVQSGLMFRGPSLSSAVLGVVALTLTGVIVGRVSANSETAPTDFTPVVIRSVAADQPIEKPAPSKKPSPASKPEFTHTSGTGTQIDPTPRNISDVSGDDHGGTTSAPTSAPTSNPTSDSSGSDDSDGSSGKDGGGSDGSSGSDGGGSGGSSDSTDHN